MFDEATVAEAGRRLRMAAPLGLMATDGRGRVTIARVDDLLDEYAGCLRTGGELARTVEGLRGEWD